MLPSAHDKIRRIAVQLLFPLVAFGAVSFSGQLRAQDKAPYSVMYWDFGGDVFSPHTTAPLPPLNTALGAFGPTVPRQQQLIDQKAASLTSAGGFRAAMGVRPIRYLQIDAVEADILGNYNGFGNRTSTFQCIAGCSGTTSQTIGSVSGLITTGARGVLPLFRERLLISAGAGFGWLRTNEHVYTQSNVTAQCSSCRSVGGHGPTEVVGVMYMLERRFGIGFHMRNVQITSFGLNANDPAIYPAGTRFKDRFWLIGGDLSIRFARRY